MVWCVKIDWRRKLYFVNVLWKIKILENTGVVNYLIYLSIYKRLFPIKRRWGQVQNQVRVHSLSWKNSRRQNPQWGWPSQRQGRVRESCCLPLPPPCHDLAGNLSGEVFPALRPYQSAVVLLTRNIIQVGWPLSNPLGSDFVLQHFALAL